MAVVGPAPARVVALTGSDRRSYLEAVTTQAVVACGVGDVAQALILDPNGRPLAELTLIAGDDVDLLVVPNAAREHILGVTARQTFLADAAFELRDDVVWTLVGDAEALDAIAAVDLGRWTRRGDVIVARHGQGGLLIGGDSAVAAVVTTLQAAGVDVADGDGLEDARIRAGTPRFGIDVVPPHLPEEAGLLPTHVHLSKGCYPGQEAVARMWMLGKPRRALAVLRGSDLQAGTERGEGRARVAITSATRDGTAGLGYVPADSTPGTTLEDLEIVALIGAGVTPAGWDPAQTRRRDRPPASAS